jgi:hypothetical protein
LLGSLRKYISRPKLHGVQVVEALIGLPCPAADRSLAAKNRVVDSGH